MESNRINLILVGYIRDAEHTTLERRYIIPLEIYKICNQYYMDSPPLILVWSNRHTGHHLVNPITATVHQIVGLDSLLAPFGATRSLSCNIPHISDYITVLNDGQTSYHGLLCAQNLYLYEMTSDNSINIAHSFESTNFCSVLPNDVTEVLYCNSSKLVVYASSGKLHFVNLRNIKHIESDICNFNELMSRNPVPKSLQVSKRWKMSYLSSTDSLFVVAFGKPSSRGTGYNQQNDKRKERISPCGIMNLGTCRWRNVCTPLKCMMTKKNRSMLMCNNGMDMVYVMCWEHMHYFGLMLQSYNVRKDKWSVLFQADNWLQFLDSAPGIILYDESRGITMFTEGGNMFVLDLRGKKEWVMQRKDELKVLCDCNTYCR